MGPISDEVTDELGRVLGGTVQGLRRLSGGASRITSSFELVRTDGTTRPLILQQERAGGLTPGSRVAVETALLRAAAGFGVPVPHVVASGAEDGLAPGWQVVARIEGETIPRRILRDPEWATARKALCAECGTALAAIHRIDPASVPDLPRHDPLRHPLPFLDGLGETRPALELGVRWLEANRPPEGPRVTVHGDFRMGNLLVTPDGLGAVLDWELAHVGDPVEDIGWLCARSWRFGGPGRVGGFGDLPDLLDAYRAAGGGSVDAERVRWWEAYAAVKWAVICALQAATHLSGATRSVELAAIGRRVCESEWDLLLLLGVAPDRPTPDPAAGDDDRKPKASDAAGPFGRPTARELVEAVREHLGGDDRQGTGRPSFHDRVARNALAIVERELSLGPAIARAHVARLGDLGFDGDAPLSAAIRAGAFDHDLTTLARALAPSTRDQLLVANPSYLDAAGD